MQKCVHAFATLHGPASSYVGVARAGCPQDQITEHSWQDQMFFAFPVWMIGFLPYCVILLFPIAFDLIKISQTNFQSYLGQLKA